MLVHVVEATRLKPNGKSVTFTRVFRSFRPAESYVRRMSYRGYETYYRTVERFKHHV